MTRALRVIPAGAGVHDALRHALAGGDAVLVSTPGSVHPGLPDEVPLRVALVVETSGSTGPPKRVAIGADALLANAAASESALGGPGQWVLALPTHYIAGLNVLARSIAADTQPVSVRGEHFSAGAFVAAARRLTVPERYTSLVPAQLAALLDDPTARAVLHTFRGVVVGGQATPPALVDRAREAGIRVVRSYGSSETSGGCVYDGTPIGTTSVRIEDGEVWLAGPSLAEGYLGDEELTAERFVTAHGHRWFRTADAGSTADGVLRIDGRRDDVLISGGVKVSLPAIERVLHELPGFADAVVVAGPHPRWGEVPVAFVVGEELPDEDAARSAVAAALGPAARPDRFIRLEAMPMLASGKPDRVALRSGIAG